jgi:hypothetical protein
MKLEDFYYWRYKTPRDNAWRPLAGASPIKNSTNLPTWTQNLDLEAAVPDVALFIAGASAFAYLRQLPHLGWTAPVNPFINQKTMIAMHRTTIFLTPTILLLQVAGKDYRQFIPRWNHDRERRRGEVEARQHVNAGMAFGLGVWTLRMFVFGGVGRKYWAPMDVILGGALTDLLHREHRKAHGL